MAFFDIFKKKQDTPPTGEQAQKQQEELSAGLEKTKTGLFSKLARAVAGRSTIDAGVLDDLEEVLISSDVGVETTVKIIRRIEERVARDKYMNASELQSILRGEIATLMEDAHGSSENFGLDATEGQPYVVMVVGVNGAGKTTLFQILMGEMEPDEGTYKWGITTSRAYFPLDSGSEFDNDYSIVDWLTQYSEEKDATYVRGFLGRMLFAGDDGVKKVKVLSGGEKVRCLLSKMMISGANVLVLDEPTNHLDMESITALNNGLIKFPGVLLFTCHDHQFVQTTANRIMEILPNGALIDKMTTYDEYLASDEMARKRHVYTMTEEDN